MWLGLASHVLAGIFPFIAAATIARLGLVPAATLIYGIGAVGLVVSLVAPVWRRIVAAETRALWRDDTRWRFVVGLTGFLVAGVAYYVGLSHSPRVVEYIFLTRLDWILQAPVAILLLREPWTGRGLTGGAIALTGGILLAWTGAIGPSGLVAAAIYIVASLAGYGAFTPLSARRGPRGAATLTAWRHWINTAGFVALLATMGGSAGSIDAAGLALGAAGAVAIVLMFLLRFTALTGIPLWVLSVQAPVQASVAVLVTFFTGGTLPLATIIAIALVVVGEYVVAVSQMRRASQLRASA